MATPLTADELAALRALDASVPRGPWHPGKSTGRNVYMGPGPRDDIGKMDTPTLGTFVCTVRNVLPALLDRLAELEGAEQARAILRHGDPVERDDG
jgi:hypothetical protein